MLPNLKLALYVLNSDFPRGVETDFDISSKWRRLVNSQYSCYERYMMASCQWNFQRSEKEGMSRSKRPRFRSHAPNTA